MSLRSASSDLGSVNFSVRDDTELVDRIEEGAPRNADVGVTSIERGNDGEDTLRKRNVVLEDARADVESPKSTRPMLEMSVSSEIELRQFTFRSVAVGVCVGSLMSFSNMYFGLQTGWVTMGSLQCSILGFLVFKTFETKLKTRFTYIENVVLQTAAVGTATMPLAGGFVGIVPALEMMGVNLTWWQLFLWSLALSLFGVFFAVPLRKQTIIREKLRFPSGTATAQLIRSLHKIDDQFMDTTQDESKYGMLEESNEIWSKKWKLLLGSFLLSSVYSIITYFYPICSAIPLFTYMGFPAATLFGWTIAPSFSYVGQGMIMGPRTVVNMFAGALFGWALLGPIARFRGWASGPVSSWKTGATGWILWVSLAIMLGESLCSIAILAIRTGIIWYQKYKSGNLFRDSPSDDKQDQDPAPAHQQVPLKWWLTGTVASGLMCVAIVTPLFNMRFYEPLVAVILGCLTSVLAVRALGETDLNPVSGIGKLSQIIFGGISPGNVIANLIAGGISEAGAQQAGDMMQDLKTGHLLRASPRAQFYAQLIGSLCSTVVAVAAYELYKSAYTLGSPVLPVPTAQIWRDMAELVNGGKLAPNVEFFCIGLGLLAATLPIFSMLLASRPKLQRFVPCGVAFAIGMYVTPNWTLPRVVGGLIQYIWHKKNPASHDNYMIVTASGLVLGAGVCSIITAIMQACKVPLGRVG